MGYQSLVYDLKGLHLLFICNGKCCDKNGLCAIFYAICHVYMTNGKNKNCGLNENLNKSTLMNVNITINVVSSESTNMIQNNFS